MSLRARLMLGLLALAAVGLLVADAISYAALRSYLFDRTDQQVQTAVQVVGRGLGAPQVIQGGRGRLTIPVRRHPPAGLPVPRPICRRASTGSFGIRRARWSTRRGPSVSRSPSSPRTSRSRALPVRPAVFTVPGTGPSDFRAAAYSPGPGAGTVVAAVSLQDVNQTLSHLRLIGGVVTAAVLAALAALAWWVIRIGLRPLERMHETANAIAGGDIVRAGRDDRRAHRGRPPRGVAQLDAGPDRARLRGTRGERGAPAPVPGRCVPRAPDPAHLDPRLRGGCSGSVRPATRTSSRRR